RFEMAQLRDLSVRIATVATDAERGPLEAQRKKQAQACVAAYERALMLADKTATRARVAEAQYLLARCHLAAGNAAKAMDVAETLARVTPPVRYSAAAANYALEVGALLLARNDTVDVRQCVRGLAGFVLKDRKDQWQQEPATD